MTGAEHLIAWAESDRTLYLALCDLERRQRPEARDRYLSATGAFYAASNLVVSAFRDATKCGDMHRGDITPQDLAQATLDALSWRMEP